ncbi:MAG: hypothetical protein K6347_06435 [Campylobacterales bacterium]
MDDAITALIEELDMIGMSRKATIREVFHTLSKHQEWHLDDAVEALCRYYKGHEEDVAMILKECYDKPDPKLLRLCSSARTPLPSNRITPKKSAPATITNNPLPAPIAELLELYDYIPAAYWDKILKQARQFKQMTLAL